MQVRFGTVSTSDIKTGVRLMDHHAGQEVLVSDVYRETPDATDHSGLFQMYLKLNGGSAFQPVSIDDGEQVTRFSKIG
jgi:hypothetical protein